MDWVTVTSIVKWLLIAGFAGFYLYQRKRTKTKAEYQIEQAPTTSQTVKYED